MTSELRWRILSLQAVLVLVFAFLAGVAFWGAGFAHSNVKEQLAAQKITMPNTSIPAVVAGLSKEDVNALKPYSNQLMTTGTQAQAFANHYIQVHMNEATTAVMGHPATYDEVSGTYMELTGKGLAPTDPQVAKISSLRQTVFMGTMLRGSLLQAYGWDQVASYVLLAAYGLTLATIVVLAAFLFELVIVPRREPIIEGKTLVTRVGASA